MVVGRGGGEDVMGRKVVETGWRPAGLYGVRVEESFIVGCTSWLMSIESSAVQQ